MSMEPAPPAKSALARHRVLSPSASVRVSPLCIGGMNFGEAWGKMMGHMPKSDVFELLDYFHAQGGNFIDTSNNYQGEESETWIGEWLAAKPGRRDEMVVATKYTTSFRNHIGHDEHIHTNTTGNSTKSLHVSLRESLRKLRTDYIDILYVHWWDFSTSIEEVMTALNTVCDQGKVLYLGISDTPAWIVAKANQWARDHGKRQFVVYQGRWSAANRDFERDILPMCRVEGMGIAPWGALGGGNFKTDEQREAMGSEGRQRPAGPDHAKVTVELDKIAKRKNTAITSVALAYVMHKAPYVFPIVGGRKISHLKGNIEALSLALTPEDIEHIEQAIPFDIGFPMNFLGNGDPKKLWLLNLGGSFDFVESQKPIAPVEEKKE